MRKSTYYFLGHMKTIGYLRTIGFDYLYTRILNNATWHMFFKEGQCYRLESVGRDKQITTITLLS